MTALTPTMGNSGTGPAWSEQRISSLLSAMGGFIQGKPEVTDLAVTCLLAEGHLLLEDVPGVGKTSLARVLSIAAGVSWHRIQCTPDVLPSDVTGVSIWDPGTKEFEFHPGPVFASVVLADEINRATPRTQAALLEAMEEHTVSVDGVTHALPSPFFVIATQNPIEMAGTYPLPEAQLDRFLMRTSIGYPDHSAEVAVLSRHHAGDRVSDVLPVLSHADLSDLIASAASVEVDGVVLDYIVRIVSATRTKSGVLLGASPRGSLGLLRAARARALVRGRSFVVPGDIQELAEPVLAHRLVLEADALANKATQAGVIAQIIEQVPAPQGN
ncbi:MAG: MoxR family ATPase [Actinomycetota bacterium]|nr:MoxR family ATPase [Actinomycetota bacterium]